MTGFIDFTAGTPAREADFFFRDAFIDNLWDSLRKEHVLILAPRRMGKTSVMLRLQDEPRDDRLVVFLNVEDLNSPAEFCQSLIAAIQEQQPEYFRNILAKGWDLVAGILGQLEEVELYKFKMSLRKADPDWEQNWKTKADELIARMRRSKRNLLLIIDELPDMVLNVGKKDSDQLDTFLHWYRAVRQDPHKDNIRWLVGGSVNLRETLDQRGQIRLTNDFRVEPLPPFSDQEVQEFVETMLRQRDVPFAPEVVERVRQLLGKPIPLFLQLLTQELFRDWWQHQEPLEAKHVESVFNRVLLGEIARDKLQHFRSRIHTHYPDDEKAAAFDLLDRLSSSDEPLTRDALVTAYGQIEATKAAPRKSHELKDAFNDLMLLLQNDFYVEDVADGRFDFASRTLKL